MYIKPNESAPIDIPLSEAVPPNDLTQSVVWENTLILNKTNK